MRLIYRRTVDGKLIVGPNVTNANDVVPQQSDIEHETYVSLKGFDVVFRGSIDPVVIFSRHGESMTFTLQDILELPSLVVAVINRLPNEHPCEVTDDALADKLDRLSNIRFGIVLADDHTVRPPMSPEEERALREIRRKTRRRRGND